MSLRILLVVLLICSGAVANSKAVVDSKAIANSDAVTNNKASVRTKVKKSATKPVVPTREEILQLYSYEQLQDAANYLEQHMSNPKMHLLKCDPAVKKAKIWLSGPMHSLMDAQKPNLLESYSKNPNSLNVQIQNCATICQCSAYSGILEAAGSGLDASEIHKTNVANLKEQITKQDKAQELACSKKSLWFCGSPLLRFLENQK